MFDKAFLLRAGDAHHHTHVEMVDPSIEKGARFLDEVQDKAHERIVKAMLVEVPAIGISILRYEIERLPYNMNSRHRVAFTINGRNYDLGISHDDWEKPERVVEIVIEHIAKAILTIAVGENPRLVPHLGFGKR